MSFSANSVTNDYCVEVSLMGEQLDPSRISSILNMEPSKSAAAGEPRRKDRADSVYEEGFWAYEVSSSDDVTECRDHQIICIADMLEPHVASLREAGVERIHFYFTLSSFYGMMNIRLKSATMQKLAEIGADLYLSGFDCFNPNHPFWNDAEVLEVEESNPEQEG